MDNMLSTRQAADLLGCHLFTVYGYIRDGRLSAQKIGHAVILDRAEVERFAAARRIVKGTAEKVEAAS